MRHDAREAARDLRDAAVDETVVAALELTPRVGVVLDHRGEERPFVDRLPFPRRARRPPKEETTVAPARDLEACHGNVLPPMKLPASDAAGARRGHQQPTCQAVRGA